MAEWFRLPMLGQTMEEGTIVQWFKQEGDTVKAGEPLLEVMSDKASIEVPAESAGVLRKILAPVDATVPVHSPIAILGTADEPIDALLAGAEGATAPAPAAAPASRPPAAPAPAPQPPAAPAPAPAGPVNASPRARRIADERGVPIAALAGRGTGPRGRIIEPDVLAYAREQTPAVAPAGAARPRTTPLAARIAEDLGVRIEDLSTGLTSGRVTADAVRRHAEAAAPAVEAPAAPAPEGPVVAQVIPYRGMRKMVADTVARSRQTAPHVTITAEVDMTEAIALHGRLQPEVLKAYDTKLTYTDVLVKAVARALAEHPLCNAALVGDEIRLYGARNVGVAVSTDNGLVVPVIRDADRKPLGAVSVELKALAERCRTGKQTQEDLSGGTFTITNLGMFGVDHFDPILVPPQAAILGVCRIVKKPLVIDDAVAIHATMNLCLSFDHRVLDGVPAARFLQRVKELLQAPLMIFI
ncbi:MAG: 2-oxo acid dehydrogenase subunit E2 [Chthonomonadales bacterium]|nr:2-oxo acid dehydrogenase subunit E2 [Chthonomonadales bacterium]